MSKAAIVLMADTDTHADLGRAVNALMTAREFKEGGDDVRLIFDGAGTKWPSLIADPQHKAYELYEAVADVVAGACGYCSRAFEAERDGREQPVPLLEDYHGHPSIRTLVKDGYQGPDLLKRRLVSAIARLERVEAEMQ
jgi:hypothetical protein